MHIQIQTKPGWKKPQLTIYCKSGNIVIPITINKEKKLKKAGVAFEG